MVFEDGRIGAASIEAVLENEVKLYPKNSTIPIGIGWKTFVIGIFPSVALGTTNSCVLLW